MTERRYIFLIGAARSGTKFLRDALARSSDVAEVPYDINYVWRHGNEKCEHDELSPGDVNDRTANHIRRTIDRLALKGRSDDPPVVLEKTVSNTLRMDLVRRVFPEAEFIVLERNGLDVVESAYRQWTLPADKGYLRDKIRYFPIQEWRYALWFATNLLSRSSQPIWGPRYDGIQRDVSEHGIAVTCAKQWRASIDASREASSRLGGSITQVRYEELSQSSAVDSFVGEVEIPASSPIVRQINQQFSLVSGWPGAIPENSRNECERIVVGGA